MKKIIILFIFIICIQTTFAWNTEINFWNNSYTLEYENEEELFRIILFENNLKRLDTFFENETYHRRYFIEWNNLDNYNLNYSITYLQSQWETILSLFNKYWINLEEFLNLNIFSLDESKNYIDRLVQRNLGNLIQRNSNNLNQLKQELYNKLFIYKVNLDNSQTNNSFKIDINIKNQLYNILKLWFENKINNNKSLYESQYKIFNNEKYYLNYFDNIENIDELMTKYDWAITSLNNEYNKLLWIINNQLTSEEISNLNNLRSINQEIEDIFVNVNNNVNFWYPYIYNSTIRTNLINENLKIKDIIESKIINLKTYIESIIESKNNQIDYNHPNWIYVDNWIIYIKQWYNITNNSWNLITDWYEDFINEQINNNYETDLELDLYNSIKLYHNNWVKKNIIDLWFWILNNLWVLNEIDEKLNTIWVSGIKIIDNINILINSYKNINQNSTFQSLIKQEYYLADDISTLTTKYLQNFLKRNINNQNLKNQHLPIYVSILSEFHFINYLFQSSPNFFGSYDKDLYETTPEIDDIDESLVAIDFWFNPLTEIITDNNWVNIWMKSWNVTDIFLDNDEFEIILDKNYNYKINVWALKSDITALNIFLQKSDWENIPIFIKGIKEFNWNDAIKYTIENHKESHKNKTSLFVNEIIRK